MKDSETCYVNALTKEKKKDVHHCELLILPKLSLSTPHAFERELDTSEGIFRKMYASLSCVRSKSDYRFRPEGPVWEDPLQSLFTCCKETVER